MNAPIDRQPCRSGAGDHPAEGLRAPALAEAAYTWQAVADGIYAIAWRRTEGSTAAGQPARRSRATSSPELNRLELSLRGL
ncbi:hypothetical protein EGY31_13365 [Burkholderia multivorans]|uniref:hypothetical protein n=1 Tax=Burkholderia ubonensis TaxID=101571 RepID=UPI000F71A130|nr:hypothetical protein [Burkholderia ubonensis]AYZ64092.1 hypothetical protein EGY31_13365 [Burkholderia multivorans]VWB75995.1 hypothetical protein BUB20358_03573 [Burkholderia ubonensis]